MTPTAVLGLQKLPSLEELDRVAQEVTPNGCCWTGSWTTCPGCTFTCEASF